MKNIQHNKIKTQQTSLKSIYYFFRNKYIINYAVVNLKKVLKKLVESALEGGGEVPEYVSYYIRESVSVKE